MQIEHESEHFAWAYDGLMGVGRFIRKADDALTYMETGSDCAQVRRDLNRLKSKTGAKDYPGPGFASIFDSIASEYTFYGDDE